MSNLNKLPKQRVSLKEKLKNDKQWAKDVIDYLSFYSTENIEAESDYTRMRSNYLLYNNILDQTDFENECNPMGIEVGQFKDEIKPYNKTYNKIQVLLGEELKRKFDFRAVTVNSDGIKEKETVKTKLLQEWFVSSIEKEKQKIMAEFQKKNPPPQQQQQQQSQDPQEAQRNQQIMEEYQNQMMAEVDKVMDPEEIEKYMSTEYQDAREILVQKIINYLTRELDIRDKSNDSFKHACLSAKEILWVGIVNDEPHIEVINPLNFFHRKSPEQKLIEKSEYSGHRSLMTVSEILNRWEEDLTKEDKEKLDGEFMGVNGMRPDLLGPSMKYHNVDIEYEYNKRTVAGNRGSYDALSGDEYEVLHVEWVSRAKVGFITDLEGNVDMVSEDFPIPENSKKETVLKAGGTRQVVYTFPTGEKLEWMWVPEVWEGTRIGYDIYVNIRKKAVQHRSIDNPFDVKLGYHGLIYNNMNAPAVSLMDRMKPFQYLYFIVMHKLKRLIGRDKGQVFSIDTSMIDERLGLEKTLYYLEEMDYEFFNSLQNADERGAAQRGKVKGATPRSNMQHIAGYLQLLAQLDMEIGDAAGVTKQREGQIGSYETATNASQSINQSNHITEIFFHLHYKVWERAMTSLVQVCQHSWKDKKVVKQFVLDDLSRHVLSVDGKDLNNSDIGIYISNSIRDAELIDTLKQMALPILQNEGKITDIIKIYNSLSAAELNREFAKEEKAREKAQQQQQQAAQQLEEKKIQSAKEMQERLFEHELQKEQMETDRVRMKAEIDVFKFQQDLDNNNDGVPDPLQIEQLKADNEYKAKKMDQDMKIHQDKMKLEKEKISAQKQNKAQNKK